LVPAVARVETKALEREDLEVHREPEVTLAREPAVAVVQLAVQIQAAAAAAAAEF